MPTYRVPLDDSRNAFIASALSRAARGWRSDQMCARSLQRPDNEIEALGSDVRRAERYAKRFAYALPGEVRFTEDGSSGAAAGCLAAAPSAPCACDAGERTDASTHGRFDCSVYRGSYFVARTCGASYEAAMQVIGGALHDGNCSPHMVAVLTAALRSLAIGDTFSTNAYGYMVSATRMRPA